MSLLAISGMGAVLSEDSRPGNARFSWLSLSSPPRAAEASLQLLHCLAMSPAALPLLQQSAGMLVGDLPVRCAYHPVKVPVAALISCKDGFGHKPASESRQNTTHTQFMFPFLSLLCSLLLRPLQSTCRCVQNQMVHRLQQTRHCADPMIHLGCTNGSDSTVKF